MLNAVQIMGRLTADPELKKTQSAISVCTFRIGTARPKFNKDAEQQSDFFTCEAWRGTAELITKYFHKGDLITIEGTLRTDSYTKDDEKRIVTKILVNNVHFTKKMTTADSEEQQMEKEFEKSMTDDVEAIE